MSEFAPWTLDALAWVATYTIHSTLMITAVALIVRYREGISPHARDLLWKVALVGPLATASLHFGLGVGGLGGRFVLSDGPAPTEAAAPVLAAAAAPPPAPLFPEAPPPASQVIISDARSTIVLSVPSRPSPPPLATPLVTGAAMTSAAAATASPAPSTPAALTPNLAALLLGLLGAGSLLSLGLFARRLRSLKRLLADRRATVEDPALELFIELTSDLENGRAMRLSTTDAISSPVALLGREVCVPTRVLDGDALPPAELRAMLAHEVAHLVRRDPEWLTASAVLESVLFFQPLLRLVRRRMVDNSELLCDAWARERTGDGLALAKCIERVAGWMSHGQLSLASAMARPQSPVVDRIRRLVMPADRRRLSGHQRVGVGLAILGAVAWLAPSVSAARDDESPVPEVDTIAEGAELCPYGSAEEGCDSWHRTLVGEPVDDGWSSMMFNPHANPMNTFTAAGITASSDLSRRELRRERRRAKQDTRHAERRQARIDRERRQLAAQIREADDEARRASDRARRLEARARRLDAPTVAPPGHSERVHVEVKRASEGCSERRATSAPRHVLRLDSGHADPVVVELNVEGLEGLGDLNFDLDLGDIMASVPQPTQAEMLLGGELLGEIARSGLISEEDMREVEQDFAEAKREIAEAKRELLEEELDGLSEPMRRGIERELAKAEREMAKVERELSRSIRESGVVDVARGQSKAQKEAQKAQREAQRAQREAQRAQREAQKAQRKAEQRAREKARAKAAKKAQKEAQKEAQKRAKKRAKERGARQHGV